MAARQNDTARTASEGVCRKLYNAVSPLRATIRRLSHLPSGSILSQDRPAAVGVTKMIPIESELPAREREIQIAYGKRKASKSVSFSKARPKKDENCGDDHDAIFHDYISKVRNRMMKAMSNVGHDKGA